MIEGIDVLKLGLWTGTIVCLVLSNFIGAVACFGLLMLVAWIGTDD